MNTITRQMVRAVARGVAAVALVLALGMAPLDASKGDRTERMKESLMDRFDEELNLWGSGESHNIRGTPKSLLIAAELGELGKYPVGEIFRALREVQAKEGEKRGNFWWDYEDGEVRDNNAAFFTIHPLLCLYHEYGDQLSKSEKLQLMEIFREARIWFEGHTLPLREQRLRYPNSNLGDAICLWMVSELTDETSPELARTLEGTFRYYLESNWGWGEHLSDMYGMIVQDELVAFLLYATEATPLMRKLAETCMQELITLDAIFAGGPTVPSIRCYWFDRSPRSARGWDVWFRPYLDQGDREGSFHNVYVRHMKAAGLDQRFNFEPGWSGPVEVDCYRPAKALAWLDERWRIGAMTSYPLTVDVNENTHGLQWQSMPVSLWHVNGDWGYLQFQTEENGHLLEAPFSARGAKYGVHSRVLSSEDPQAKLGYTYGLRQGKGFLVYRRLPQIAEGWTMARDRLRLLQPSHGDLVTEEIEGWTVFRLPYMEETLTVAIYSFSDSPVAIGAGQGELEETLISAHWDLGRQEGPLGVLWYLEFGDEDRAPPEVEPFGIDFHRVYFSDGSTALLDAGAEIPWLMGNMEER